VSAAPRQPLRVAVLVASDRAARGEREDRSGPALVAWLAERGAAVAAPVVVPDEADLIAARLGAWADAGEHDLVLTCGGTGLSPRDVTPEATLAVVERTVPGLAEEMRRRSLASSPHALLSRAVAGVRRRCLVLNLPGSPRGAVENLAAVWAALPHAVGKIQGDPSDCAPAGEGPTGPEPTP
jgi:molybdenum cofactor synthesis domain-containing protein